MGLILITFYLASISKILPFQRVTTKNSLMRYFTSFILVQPSESAVFPTCGIAWLSADWLAVFYVLSGHTWPAAIGLHSVVAEDHSQVWMILRQASWRTWPFPFGS